MNCCSHLRKNISCTKHMICKHETCNQSEKDNGGRIQVSGDLYPLFARTILMLFENIFLIIVQKMYLLTSGDIFTLMRFT